MSDLAAFLTARLGEDEQRAKEAMTPGEYRWVDIHSDLEWVITQTEGDFAEALPRRVLREVAAGRAILAEVMEAACADPHLWLLGDQVLRHLAAVYRDHPDYDPAWG